MLAAVIETINNSLSLIPAFTFRAGKLSHSPLFSGFQDFKRLSQEDGCEERECAGFSPSSPG
jgi:hypothetical protein